MSFVEKLFGSNNDSKLKSYRKIADRIEQMSHTFAALSDESLIAKTGEFKNRIANGESLDDLLVEVFAQVREASSRVLGLRHYYEQLLGGIVLHKGNIAEMRTGEGKTLVATLAATLNALPGKGVHVVTVNDYLAKRDSEWMGKVYRFLGLSVGLAVKDMDPALKRQSYLCDITYGTNNEFGFDFLRDNMVVFRDNMVQRELNYAIIDEVDSILIDEARTPLIISGQAEKSTELYQHADKFVRTLKLEDDFTMDEKMHTVILTEDGTRKAEKFFNVENLSDLENTELNHHINQALKANNLMKRDKDYIVAEGEVVIVDEFTGRIMTGRRYSDGLHQAIEAKENVHVQRESKTLATITFQNYFRMYNKLGGMTGTAKTEEAEFESIYNLEVIEIPTHMPMVRKDLNDIIYTRQETKYNAIVEEIAKVHQTGQPILVGTVSVEKSEHLSTLLRRRGIKHEVLNAKLHKKEAEIIAQAGKLNAVTIATNMAGRGTDILLGGNPDFMARITLRQEDIAEEMIDAATSHAKTNVQEVLDVRARYDELYKHYKKKTDAEHDKVVELGGLYILATERHESRRIDNQLRGRAGRQGDPGCSRFYIALEDDLMRIFGGEKLKVMMERLNPNDNVPLEIGILSKQIEKAQERIESHNFDIRKRVLSYDDVMNKQREIIYSERRKVLTGEDVHPNIVNMIESVMEEATVAYCPAGVYPEEWDLSGLRTYLTHYLNWEVEELFEKEKIEYLERKDVTERLLEIADKAYTAKLEGLKSAGLDTAEVERVVLLRTVDEKWMDHIDNMAQLRQGIGLRAYGQRDPILAYRQEGFDMFDEMTKLIQEETVARILRVTVENKVERKQVAQETKTSERTEPVRNKNAKIGKNDPCPCGSGKKYKQCCGAN